MCPEAQEAPKGLLVSVSSTPARLAHHNLIMPARVPVTKGGSAQHSFEGTSSTTRVRSRVRPPAISLSIQHSALHTSGLYHQMAATGEIEPEGADDREGQVLSDRADRKNVALRAGLARSRH